MKHFRIIVPIFAVVVLTVGTAALMSGGSKHNVMAEFSGLSAEIEAVHDAFARTMTGGAAVPIERDPRLRVLQRMDKLAQAAIRQPEGAYVAGETFAWSYVLDLDVEKLPDRFALLSQNHPDAAEVLRPLEALPDAAAASGRADRWIELLNELTERTQDAQVRAAALYTKGQIQLQAGATSDARITFERSAREAPDSQAARLAERAVFGIDHLQVGKTAPEFTATTLDGAEIALSSLRGNVVLLDFWATWCPSCIGEIPRLKEISAKLADRPFRILSVSLDDTRSALDMLLRTLEPPGIHTWHEAGRQNPIALMYNAEMLPTWYLIDAEGVIRARDPFGEKLLPAIEEVLPPAGASARGSILDADAG